MLQRFKNKYIGDRQFYGYVLGITIPMILQNVVSSFVSLLDNIMVGQIGTEQMSGVAIANQLMFVYYVSIFGVVSGPGIFGAQFYGKGDYKGQQYTVRIRVLAALIFTAIAMCVFGGFGKQLIGLYLNEAASTGDVAATLIYGRQYLNIMLISLVFFGIGQSYASALRECGNTVIPMIASILAVLINLLLDYILIFGRLGMPELGVSGAAIATVIAKIIECMIVVVWAHCNPSKNQFITGLYSSFHIPSELFRRIAIKGMPLMLNEICWSMGIAVLNQCYAVRGLEVVAGQNIASTMINLFNIVYMQVGASISIIVGQQLGAGRMDRAKEYADKVLFFAEVICVFMSALMIPCAALFPSIYNTGQQVRSLATYFIRIQSLAMPLTCFVHCAYFILRSGGRTGITFVFDSVFVWVIMVPLAFCLVHFTELTIYLVFPIVLFSEVIKVVIGYMMIRSNIWLRNIVND